MTNRQRIFIAEYCKDFNATRAAKSAGYSAKTAYSIGQENLKKPEIAEAIKARIEELTMPADEVKMRLAQIARGDIMDLIETAGDEVRFRLTETDADGNVTPNPNTRLIRKIVRRTTRHVSPKGGESETASFEIELYSAADALVKIGEMHGLFRNRQVLENPDGSAVEPAKIVNIYIPDNGRPRTIPSS